MLAVAAGLVLATGAADVSCPADVLALIGEMRQTGGEVRAGYTPETGLFLVGVGHSTYKRGAINKCREVARLDAVKNVTSALSQAVQAKDVVALNMSVDSEGNAEASAFVSSLTETSVDQLVKGLQIVSSGKNAEGEMERAGEYMFQVTAISCLDLLKIWNLLIHIHLPVVENQFLSM